MKKASVAAGILVLVALILNAKSPSTSSDEKAIRAMYQEYSAAILAKDLDRVMSFYAPEIVAFDAFPPRQYVGIQAYRKDYENFFAAFPGPAKSTASDVHVKVSGPMAYAYGVDTWTITGADGKPMDMVFRFTDVLKKVNGKWLIVHEHLSFPVDPETGKADYLSKP